MTALKVLGTLLAIGVCTALMFFGIFMKYVHTTLEPVLDVDMSAITLNQSSVISYQDQSTGGYDEQQQQMGGGFCEQCATCCACNVLFNCCLNACCGCR